MDTGKVRDVLFIHIPKTGGTTICNVLGIEKTRNAQAYSFTPVTTGWYCFGHGTYRDMTELSMVTPEFLERAYTFSFVRNPYDQVVSHWAFCAQNKKWGMKPNTPFKEYVTGVMQRVSHHRPQWTYIKSAPLNFLGHFEFFEEDLKLLAIELGLGAVEIPHLNASARPHYSEVYCKETKEIVEEFYAEDFQNLGYDMEDF